MAVVPIRIVGDPVLHTPTQPVPVAADGSLPADLADLITDLYDTMDAAYGVGLAANQIGVSLRVLKWWRTRDGSIARLRCRPPAPML